MYDGGISLLGEVKKCVNLHGPVLEALQQRFGANIVISTVMQASRKKKDNQVYHSTAYRRKGKICSYLIQYTLERSHILKYGKVLLYLVVAGVPFAAIQCFQRSSRNIMSGLPDPKDDLLKAFKA